MDERSLVEQARRGDHDAFTVLARSAILRLGPATRLILRDPELARDAVQEALISAWRELPRLRDADRFEAWLYRLTVNASLALLRRRRRRPVEVEIPQIDMAATGDMASGIADRDRLDRALGQLEPDRRALVVLHIYLGFSMPEVADQLGIPLGTAKSRLNRSLAALRVAVEDELDPVAVGVQEEGQLA